MSIEAMKRVLEAWQTSVYGSDSHHKAMLHAITNMGQAIAEAEKQEPVEWGVDWGKAGDTPCVSIIKRKADGRIEVIAVEYAPYTHPQPKADHIPDATKMVEQEQGEPVAFVVKQYVGDGRPSIKGNGFDGLEIGYTREEAEEFVGWINSHITTPQQRTWVGLTDEDVKDALRKVMHSDINGVVRAIEAKLKEKNG